MTKEEFAKLRSALLTFAPATQALIEPKAYPGLVVTQAPAEQTDLDEVVDEAFESAQWPEREEAIPLAGALTPEQRALADLVASVPGVPLGRWAIPQAAWARRRWLGLDPAGAVERHDLARKLHAAEASEDDDSDDDDDDDDDDKAAALFLALPLAERLEAWADLSLGAYHVDPPSLGDLELDDLGDAGRTWAPAFADRLVALFAPATPHVERGNRHAPDGELTALLFRALLAAGVPIEERWDRFVPLDDAVLAALPAPRRDAVLVEDDDFALSKGLDLVAKFPTAAMVDHLIARSVECTSSLMSMPRRWYLDELRDAVEAHPELAARVDAHVATLPPLPVLHCTKKLYVKHVDQLSAGLRTMLGVLGQGWDLVTLDDDEEPVFPEEIDFVSAYEIADDSGPAFEALFYMDEDGSVCRVNTTSQVMMASQTNLSWNVDDLLAEALHEIVSDPPDKEDEAD